ncbi:MAG: HNH endonuclease [Sedimentisphaerales bacterium]
MYLKLQIKIPAIIESIIVYFLLRYRKKKFGYPFRLIKLIGGKSAEARLGETWSAGQKPAETNLAAAKFAKVDPEDYQKLAGYVWLFDETNITNPYAVRFEGRRKFVKMHREIMNAPKGVIVDHKNGNGLDNRKVNLRFATIFQNNCNRRTKKTKQLQI